MEYIKMLQTLGLKGTYRHLYMFKRIKVGTLMGVDQFGNKYFENTEYPYGQHRWVEHKNWDSGMLADASNIPPLWHPWMHYMTDEVPKDNQIPTLHRTGKTMTVETHTPVKNHYNTEHLKEWRVNPTLKRERGYGFGSYYSEVGENSFYVQPGHPMSPFEKENEQHVEAWGGQPSAAKGQQGVGVDSPWQKFYKQRLAMNKTDSASS